MMVNEHTVDAATIRLFREAAIKAGEQLSLENLKQEWSCLNLRRGDLVKSLRRLEHQGCLQSGLYDGKLMVTLLSKGEQRTRERSRSIDALLRGLQALELSLIDHRKPTDLAAVQLRRATDDHSDSGAF